MTEEERIGKIRTYFPDRGFGFLEEDDLFFHIKSIPETIHPFIEEGLKVNYTKKLGEKGPIAIISSTVDELESIEEIPKFSGEYIIVDPKKILIEETIEEIKTSVDQNGAILIPGVLRRFPNSFGKVRKNEEEDVVGKIEKHLEETFDDLSVTRYDLFRPKKKPAKPTSPHPYQR